MIGALKAFRIDFVNLFGARRPRGEPSVLGDNFQPSDRGAVSGRIGERRNDFLAREVLGGDLISGDSLPRIFFCSAVAGASMRSYTGRAEFPRQIADSAAPGSWPVYAVISAASKPGTMPSLSVVHTEPSRRRNDAPALSSPPNPIEPSMRPSTNHLKPTGTSTRRRPSDCGHAIDHAAADDRLADRGILGPSLAMLEQVGNCYREVMIRVHQSRARSHDAVAIVVGVVGECDIEAILHLDQPRHRIRRRAIHPDLAVPIHAHETKSRIDGIVHDRRLDPIALDDRSPVVHARAAERIDADAHAGVANRVQSTTLARSLTYASNSRGDAWSRPSSARSNGMRFTPRSPSSRIALA